MADTETSEHTLGSGVVGAKGGMIMHAEGREGQYVIHFSIPHSKLPLLERMQRILKAKILEHSNGTDGLNMGYKAMYAIPRNSG
jgi:hypothetical protein